MVRKPVSQLMASAPEHSTSAPVLSGPSTIILQISVILLLLCVSINYYILPKTFHI